MRQRPTRQPARYVPVIVVACVLGLGASACTGSPGTGTPTAGSAGTVPSASATAGASAPAASGPAASASPSASASSPAALGKGLPAVPGIVKEVEPSVVTIQTEIGLGSGVVYKADGVIVTDAHVVEDQQKNPYKNVQVQFADGSQVPGSVVGVDDVSDVAVLKVQRKDLPAAKFSASLPEVGALAVVLGSPLGLAETVTAGIVSALHRNMPGSSESPQPITDLIQTDAPISPGNSGGAVVNGDAEVIGLSEAYLPPSSGAVAIGFVTPSTTVVDVADQLLTNGTVKHPSLGVVPTDITPQVAQRFNLPTTTGALVLQVVSGGPADKAGIQPGDIITSFAGKSVTSSLDLVAAVRGQDPGSKVDVVVRRGSATKTVQVTLGSRD